MRSPRSQNKTIGAHPQQLLTAHCEPRLLPSACAPQRALGAHAHRSLLMHLARCHYELGEHEAALGVLEEVMEGAMVGCCTGSGVLQAAGWR